MELWNLWYASKWTLYQFFCRFVISKTRVTLLHMHRCQFYSAWFLIGSYCTGDWKLKILIAICSWHSITSRIGKILVANASKLVAPYSTELCGQLYRASTFWHSEISKKLTLNPRLSTKNTPVFLFPYIGHSLQIFAKVMPMMPLHTHLFSFTHNAVVLSNFRCVHPENQTKIFWFLHFMNQNKCRLHKTWWSLERSIALQLQGQTDLLLCTVKVNCFPLWARPQNMAVGDLAFYYTLVYIYAFCCSIGSWRHTCMHACVSDSYRANFSQLQDSTFGILYLYLEYPTILILTLILIPKPNSNLNPNLYP